MSPALQSSEIIRARNAVWATFGIMGVVSMAWIPRIPEIKNSLALNDGEFGLMLVGSTLGAFCGTQLAGRLVHTFGTRRVSAYAAVGMPLGLIAMGFASNPIQLFFSLFLMGMGYSSLDISVNTQAVEVEKLLERRWMSKFHATWSTGAFIATIFGGAIARVTTPRFNLVSIGVVSLFLYIPAIRALLGPEFDGHNGGQEETEAKIPLLGRAVLPLWAMGLGLFGDLVVEGASGDWGGLLLRDHMGIEKGTNSAAFASFALAMILSRFFGDRTLTRFGPAKTVKLGGYIGGAAFGASIAIAVPLSSHWKLGSLIVICVGFFIAGIGVGPIFPAYILAASSVSGIAPSVAIARVGVIALMAFFIGPALIGGVAQVTSLPIALALPAIMLMFSGYQSRVIKRSKSEPK